MNARRTWSCFALRSRECTAPGLACGAGRVAPAACAAGLARARLDFRSGSKTCRNLAGAGSPQFLDQAKVEAWRSRLAGEPAGLLLELKGEGKDGCNLCTHAHPRVAEFLRARRFAFHPRLDGPAICGDVPRASLPPGTLTVGIHVRRGDCPKWRYVGWDVYRGVLLCGNQPLVWGVLTKLQNSLSRSNRSRFG